MGKRSRHCRQRRTPNTAWIAICSASFNHKPAAGASAGRLIERTGSRFSFGHFGLCSNRYTRREMQGLRRGSAPRLSCQRACEWASQRNASGLRPSRSPPGAEPAPRPPANSVVPLILPVIMPIIDGMRYGPPRMFLNPASFAGGGLGEPASVPPIGGAGAKRPARIHTAAWGARGAAPARKDHTQGAIRRARGSARSQTQA